jgi:hypothetical protein
MGRLVCIDARDMTSRRHTIVALQPLEAGMPRLRFTAMFVVDNANSTPSTQLQGSCLEIQPGTVGKGFRWADGKLYATEVNGLSHPSVDG